MRQVARNYQTSSKISLIFKGLSYLLFASLFINPTFALANSGITYHGKILKPDGVTPVSSATTQFRIQVRTPGTENCLLWEEQQTKDLSSSGGVFTITVADSAEPSLIANTLPFPLERVFSNRTNFTSLTGCSAGSSYNPSSTDGRSLVVYFRENPTDSWEQMPITKVNYVPLALNSVQLEGYAASEFLKVSSASSYTPLTATQVNTLMDIIAGTNTQYLRPATTFSGDVSGTYSATSVDKIKGVSVTTTAPTNGQVLKYNGTAWAPAADDTGSTVSDASYATKGIVQINTDQATSGLYINSGVLALPNVITAGGPTGGASTVPVITYDQKGRLTAVTTATVDDTTKLPLAGGTMTGNINMGTKDITNATNISSTNVSATNVSATNASVRNLVLNDNDTNTVTIKTPTDVAANYALTLPGDDGTSGQVLSTDGSGVLSWVAANSSLGLTANKAVIANGTGTALTAFSCSINQVFSFDGSGNPTCANVTAAGGFLNGGNSFGANATLGTNDNYSLTLKTNNTSRVTILNDGKIGIGVTNPSNELQVSGTTYSTKMAVGSSGSMNSDEVFKVANSTTTSNSSVPFGQVTLMAAPSLSGAGLIANYDAFTGKSWYISANTNGGSMTGVTGIGVLSSGGTIATGNGVVGYAESASGTITSARGGYFDVRTSGGTITTGYGVYIGTIDATTKYGLYQSDATAKNSLAGNLGIGNTSPNTALDVSGAISQRGMAAPSLSPAGQGRIYFDSTSNTFKVSQNGGAYADLATTSGVSGSYVAKAGDTMTGPLVNNSNSASTALAVTQSGAGNAATFMGGNVGIGTTSPTTSLEVNGTTTTKGLDINAGGLATDQVFSASNISSTANSAVDSALFSLQINPSIDGGTANFTSLKSSGVYSSANSNSGSMAGLRTAVVKSGAGTLANGYGVYSSVTTSAGTLTNGYGVYVGNVQATNKYSFYASDATAPNYFAGSVGIGTNSPNTALDLNGAFSQRGMAAPSLSAAGQGRIYFDSTSNKFRVSENGGAYADLVTSVSSSGGFVDGGNSFGQTGDLGTNDNFALNFKTNNTTQMVLNTSGNLGIGVANPTYKLDVGGHMRTTGRIESGDYIASGGVSDGAVKLAISAGNYGQGTGTGSSLQFETYNNGYASLVDQAMITGILADGTPGSEKGDLYFSTLSGATLGEKMRLTSTGRLGIGTSSPNTTLDVNGAISQRGMAAPSLSAAGQGRIYFDSTSNTFKVSQNGGAYVDLFNASGVTGSGTTGKITKWSSASAITDSILTESSGKIGIQNSSPTFNLSIGDGTANDGSIMALGYGTVGTNGTALGVSGAGTRMFWYPKKAAFRAGGVDSTQWDDANIGNYSVALGDRTIATGADSFAAGGLTRASGTAAVSIGWNNNSNANYTTTIGGGNLASGAGSTAIGWQVTASGAEAMALGQNVTASGANSIAIGAGASTATYPKVSGTNSLGIFLGDQANADITASSVMAILGGNVGVGTGSPSTILDVNGAITQRGMAAPSLSPAGQGRIYFDSTSNTFKISQNGGAYVDLYNSSGVSGSGTTGKIPKWSASSTLTDSILTELNGVLTVNGIINLPTTTSTTGIIRVNGSSYLHAFGTHNTFLGESAGTFTLTNGSATNNIGIGWSTLGSLTTGAYNIALGTGSLVNTTTGSSNVAIGGDVMDNTNGNQNVGVGVYANQALTSGNNNVALGYSAGNNITTGSNNIMIGTSVTAPSATGSYQLNIGDLIYGNMTAASRMLDVNGSFNLRGIAAPSLSSAGQGKIYFDSTSNTFKASQNGGAYADLMTTSAVSASYVAKAGDTMTGPLVNNSNSASTALAVTQSGAGYAATFMGGNVGIGTGTPSAPLSISKTNTSTSGTFYQTNNSLIAGPASASTASNTGLLSQVTNAGTGAYSYGSLTGLAAEAFVNGANTTSASSIVGSRSDSGIYGGTASEVIGASISAVSSGSPQTNVTNQYGAKILNELDGPATATNMYGAYVDLETSGVVTATNRYTFYGYDYNSGTSTKTYGLYLEDDNSGTVGTHYDIYLTSTGAATTNYGIYQNSSTNQNYFAGKVGLGTNAPGTALDVNGAISARGIASPGVSPAGQGRIYFDSTSNTFKVSQNGGGYADLATTSSVSGTSGKITKFTGSNTVGNSIMTESTGQISVAGQIYSTGNVDQTSNSPAINFNNGNSLYVTSNCTAFTLSNMVDGASYSLTVKGTSGTCSFSSAGDTMHYAGGAANVAITSHTIFSFLKQGTDVYVTWVTF